MRHVMRIKRIHHLTVAVRDIDEARATYEALFGGEASEEAVLPAFGVRTSEVPIGDDVLQLAAPLRAGGPVMRFIERKGEGFYNLALEVDDLDDAVVELSTRGIKVSEPIEAEPGVRSSFVTMAATHGLSIQLVEVTTPPESVERAPQDKAAATEQRADAEPAEDRPIDLTPDEWSDVD
jgi:methylmalonyl-CoA epimerase